MIFQPTSKNRRKTMKKLFVAVSIMLFAVAAFGGVIHESKTTVEFKGFGKYTVHETVYVQGVKQFKESASTFEGESMMGKMMGAMAFGDRPKNEIIDLDAMKIYMLFPEKRQYKVQDITPFTWDEEGGNEQSAEQENSEVQEKEETHIKITRNDFKVVPTGKSKTIHGFPCKEYRIFWITEWVNTQTGEKGKDSLFTEVWSTTATDQIKKGLKEEQAFQKKYLEKVGFGKDSEMESVLGLNWLQMFRTMHRQPDAQGKIVNKSWAKEMAKIKGYPVVVDGAFYVSVSGKKGVKKEKESFDFNDVGGMFGGMLKNKLKKKKEAAAKNEPAFAYHTELIKIVTKTLPPKRFKVPPDYQKID